jgi:hypothetical protein
MMSRAAYFGGIDRHDVGASHVLRLPLYLAKSCVHGRVRTNALIVPHFLPSEARAGECDTTGLPPERWTSPRSEPAAEEMHSRGFRRSPPRPIKASFELLALG